MKEGSVKEGGIVVVVGRRAYLHPFHIDGPQERPAHRNGCVIVYLPALPTSWLEWGRNPLRQALAFPTGNTTQRKTPAHGRG